MFLSFASTLFWAISFNCIAASLSTETDLQIRNAPRSPLFSPSYASRRALYSAAIGKREIQFQNSTSLDSSWDGVTLFHYSAEADASEHGNFSASADVNIICTTCYIKGNITAELLTNTTTFNISQALDTVKSDIEGDFFNITNSTIQFLENNITVTSLVHDIEELEFPPLPIDFDITIPDIPEVTLRLQFDGMEVYMQTETIFTGDATYSLNLYTSDIPELGASFNEDGVKGFIGLVFTVDLMLSVNAEISISSGFHLSLNDGAVIEISMFGQNVSHINFNGGNFEFLPVTISTSGATLTGILRVGAKLGADIALNGDSELDKLLEFSAGIEGEVFANVAQFVTNITASDNSSCDVQVTEAYALLLGADAGATVALRDHTWGPSPSTQTIIYSTTLGSICAISGSATVPSSAIATTTHNDFFIRDFSTGSLTTTTLSTTVTNTATVCQQAGLINCPASLQSTPKVTAVLTTVLTVPSGVDATFPAITQTGSPSTIPFGINIKSIDATSGIPTPFTPSATVSASGTGTASGTGAASGTGILSASGAASTIAAHVKSEINRHKNLVIGVCVGVGVPLLIAIFVCFFRCCKGRKSKAAKGSYNGVPAVQNSTYSPTLGKKSPMITVGTPASMYGASPRPDGRDNYFQN